MSSFFSKTLHNLTDKAVPSLRNEEAVTIQLVNLFYAKPDLNAPHHGFGYLIPNSVPASENPEQALGVLFDSDRDIAVAAPGAAASGTKFTVMLGGHHLGSLRPSDPSWPWPSPDSAVAAAKSLLSRHLGIAASEPCLAVSTKLCVDCIPQPRVGHSARMAAAHAELLAAFEGRLAVVGGSYSAPGVLPSLRAARDSALHVAGRGYRTVRHGVVPLDHVGDMGLARFARPETEGLGRVPRDSVPHRYGNRALWDEEGTRFEVVPRS